MDIAMMVKNYVDNCKEREPIFVKDVIVPNECKNARDVTFHRLQKENKIKQYEKGIYYKPKTTMFGELGIDMQQLIVKKYIKEDGHINGYITGPVLWNNLKITTQIPKRTWIATNSVKRTAEKEDLKVKLIKPKTIVNNNNYELLQLLDVIDQVYEIQDINWDAYLEILNKELKKFDTEKLKNLINLTKYYDKFVNNFMGAIIDTTFKGTNKYDQLHDELIKLKEKAHKGRKYKLTCNIRLKNLELWGFYK